MGLAYLPTFGWFFMVNLGKYTSPMGMVWVIRGFPLFGSPWEKNPWLARIISESDSLLESKTFMVKENIAMAPWQYPSTARMQLDKVTKGGNVYSNSSDLIATAGGWRIVSESISCQSCQNISKEFSTHGWILVVKNFGVKTLPRTSNIYIYPRASMYDIFTHIYHKESTKHVGKYVHGWYGLIRSFIRRLPCYKYINFTHLTSISIHQFKHPTWPREKNWLRSCVIWHKKSPPMRLGCSTRGPTCLGNPETGKNTWFCFGCQV